MAKGADVHAGQIWSPTASASRNASAMRMRSSGASVGDWARRGTEESRTTVAAMASVARMSSPRRESGGEGSRAFAEHGYDGLTRGRLERWPAVHAFVATD